jgi:hypothetical protein
MIEDFPLPVGHSSFVKKAPILRRLADSERSPGQNRAAAWRFPYHQIEDDGS